MTRASSPRPDRRRQPPWPPTRWAPWPLNQLYQNQIAVYNAEMQLQEYLKDFEENWAELEWLVGAELPRPAGGKP